MPPLYRESHALVIGINDYRKAPPLGYARQDAEAVAKVLVDRIGFAASNVCVLIDAEATALSIRSAIAHLANAHVQPNDRCCVFFAGHGHTRTGRHGEIGFLVPHDGDAEDLSSLIRWSDLTGGSDLIRARHVLFLMDACYGGLALTRTSRPGSMRFLRDMLGRAARQVLTAGKADEVVADSGGPRPGHSVFTGHLLEALEGAAATHDGVMTANGVMAYVYDKVARDPNSRQTPHYGHFDGDGDLIFDAPLLDTLPEEPTRDVDVLVGIPATVTSQAYGGRSEMLEAFKEYLSDPKHLIRLDDLLNREIRATIARIDPSYFPLDKDTPDATTLASRVEAYDAALGLLPEFVALLGRWGKAEHSAMLARVFERIADHNVTAGGYDAWLSLRWMPLDRLFYFAGIGALSHENYAMLQVLYSARSYDRSSGKPYDRAFLRTIDGIFGAQLLSLLKSLPGHERQYVPRSELYYKQLQPRLDDILFLGSSYEQLFDRLEVLNALTFIHGKAGAGTGWGPPGRFAWKHRDSSHSPFEAVVSEANGRGNEWPPLRAGLFHGDLARFNEVAEAFRGLLRRMF